MTLLHTWYVFDNAVMGGRQMSMEICHSRGMISRYFKDCLIYEIEGMILRRNNNPANLQFKHEVLGRNNCPLFFDTTWTAEKKTHSTMLLLLGAYSQ
jgi:hypothetical protein